MKQRVLQYLVCPQCKSPFRLATEPDGEEIVEGELRCEQSGHSYPITGGIPRLLPAHLAQDVQKTAQNFGWQWQEFDEFLSLDDYKSQFLDWLHPIEPSFFRDKVVLDAGCGMGRFSLASADFGAKDVLAIDLSVAVEAAYANTKHLPNVHVIQADIYNLPFATPFDFAFSIGVLHHLPDPEGGFDAIVKHLKPKGSIFAWVYGKENNWWVINVAGPLREKFFSRIPPKGLYAISKAITLMVHPVLKLIYRPVNNVPALQPLTKLLPYNGYLKWLAEFGFRHNHHVIFDHLNAPTAFYISKEEFLAWFQRAKLPNPVLSWRNQNSWRGSAVLEHADSRT